MSSSKIEVLPENVTNKIAAGEIIERPVAVIKELIENSLDAGAKHIDVGFSKGGKFSMVVEDDGSGMSQEEALLSVKRHATSKLRNIGDLDTLLTFGFRGEALPSIASVSKFRLITGRSGDSCGTEIVIEGGKITEVKDCPRLCGTRVSAENLFYNVPARRKFLKSDETESAHIISAVKNLALAEDSVKFSLYQNGGKIFSSPEICGCGARVNEIFQYGEKFIDFSHSDGNLTICGTICDPEFGNICRKNIVLFVNDRLIRSDMVNSALCEELRPIFPNHRGILAYIFLKIDPAIVDVNVHPMKMEVRFRSELSVRSLIGNCVAEIFGKRGTAIVAESRTTAATPVISVAPVAAAPTRNSSWKSSAFRTPVRSVDVERACRNIPASHGGTKMAISTAEQKVFPTHGGDSGNWCEWRFIGTAFGEIALFESKNGIIVFNIRAAASRVLYEKITSQNENPHSQLLLMPLEITLTDHEIERLQRFLPILSKYGFSIYSFGKRDYKMDAIPEWLRYEDAEILVRDLIIDCENSVKNTPRTNLEEMFARLMARSINLENFKDRDAIEKLRGALLVSKNPLACPLGHATYFEVSLSDMGHRFHEKVK